MILSHLYGAQDTGIEASKQEIALAASY